jgi:hypothetical protein
MKTIDVMAKSYFDKANGNSYFSARVIIDLDAQGNGKVYYIPYEYGYGEQYITAACDLLIGAKLLPGIAKSILESYCRNNDIVLRHGIAKGCTKEDVTAWGRP